MAWFKDNVSQKKKLLSAMTKSPMAQIAAAAAKTWADPDELNNCLKNAFCRLPGCHLIYALSPDGLQCSANVTRGAVDSTWLGQSLSERPFFKGNLPYAGMSISAAYMSQRTMKPCLTALQAVRNGQSLLGFIAADIHLNDLPTLSQSMNLQLPWLKHTTQVQGAAKQISAMDKHIDYLICVLSTLMQERGVFQVDMHFGGARCLIWTQNDPGRYAIHSVDALLEPELLEQYQPQALSDEPRVDVDTVPLLFGQFKALREIDEAIHLQSASLNLLNGLVGLRFCDDLAHYLLAEEFMNTPLDYWFGEQVHPREIIDPAFSVKN